MGEPPRRPLAGRVGGLERNGEERDHRGHVHDMPALGAPKERQERATAVEHPADVDVHDPVDVLGGLVSVASPGGHPRVVDQHIDDAEGLGHLGGPGVERLCVANVDGAGGELGARRPQLGGQLGHGGVVDVGERQPTPIAGKAARQGGADTAAGPGDDHDALMRGRHGGSIGTGAPGQQAATLSPFPGRRTC